MFKGHGERGRKMILFILQIGLLVWFFGCIVSYKTKKWTLVDGVGLKSAEFGMFVFYTAGILLYYGCRPVGKWFLFAVLAFWITVQFFCHWYFTIRGASEKKLKGYNECFGHTVRIIPASSTRLIPDFYHIVLHLLLVLNMGFLIASL